MMPAMIDRPVEGVPEGGRPSPFANKTFVKNLLASNAITPPLGESAAVRRSDWWTGICAICFVVAGVGAFLAAMWWR